MVQRLLIARHAESEFNVRQTVSARPGGPGHLTDEGRAQARRLGELLDSEPIELCVTSRIGRTCDTAAAAMDGRPVPHETWPDFDDPAPGVFEGQLVENFNTWLRNATPQMAPPGGESQVATLARHVRAFAALLERPEPVVFAVIHRLGVGWLLSASMGGEFPVVPYAQVHELKADQLAVAVDRLKSEPVAKVPY
jgi:broad specificity phosphatase PhoE